jgi:hypothetical protein
MGKVSLNEVMGKAGDKSEGLSMSDLKDLLGEKMPELPKNRVGRFRIVNALKQRFGAGFRSIPGVSNIMKEFDGDMEFENKLSEMKAIKMKE